MDDAAAVAEQLGRPLRAFRRVAARCPHGGPAVSEQYPYDASGEPFPTTYWLTCPHLVAAVSRLEAEGGVERWSASVAADPRLSESLERANREQAELRHALAAGRSGYDAGVSLDLGVGGSSRPGSLKCLHAHVAYALARRGYLLGERILADVPAPWPEEACCTV